MLVDVHAHFGQSAHGGGAAEDVARYATDGKFDAVLVANRDAASEPAGVANLDEVDANSACLSACRAHALLRPLYWVRVGHKDSNVHALRGAFELEPFVGALFSPSETGFDVGTELLDPYLAVLAALGRPAVFCIGVDARCAPAKVYQKARRQPKLPVVLCLCGAGPSQLAAVRDVVGHARRAGDANLYMDTSHATASDAITTVEVAGADRVLFGGDVFGHPDGSSEKACSFVGELRNILPAEQFRMVAGENAARLFRLAPAEG